MVLQDVSYKFFIFQTRTQDADVAPLHHATCADKEFIIRVGDQIFCKAPEQKGIALAWAFG